MGVGALVAVILVINIVRSCGKSGDETYEYERVTEGTVIKTISVSGILEVTDTARVLSKVVGAVSKVMVDFNDPVAKGQLLAVMDAVDLEQRLLKASTQIESVKLELQTAKEELESKRSMFKENLISAKGLEKAEANYKAIELKSRQYQIDYSSALKMKNDTRILAPISGMVISRDIEPNMPVMMNQPLFTIASNLKRMRLIINVDESEIGQIKKGQKVTFTVSAFPDKTFKGSISQVRINPVIKGNLVTYQSVVLCENDELLLKPGMTATTTIEVARRDKVLKVPNQAFNVTPVPVEQQGDKKFVWRTKSDRANVKPDERIEVVAGLRGDKFTEVKSPLKKGDRILIKYTKGKK